MANTSATGGPLLPAATPAPLEDAALEDFLQTLVSTLTGISGANVRPRWQPEPANIPQFGVDWAALGVVRTEKDTFAAEIHLASGKDEIRRHEELEVLTSFYGPNCGKYASQLSDNLQLAQNREVLQLAGMGLIECKDPVAFNELVKERWLRRIDLRLFLRRQIVRQYEVLNLASANVVLDNELYSTPISVVP